MEDTDFAAITAAVKDGRDDDTVALYTSFPALDWLRDGYDWKSDHAEEFSEVIQRLSVMLPTEGTSHEDFFILCKNYILPLVWIPDSIDLAAQAAVTYWNRNPGNDPQPLRDLLDLLRGHPGGERSDEIAATAVNVKWA